MVTELGIRLLLSELRVGFRIRVRVTDLLFSSVSVPVST